MVRFLKYLKIWNREMGKLVCSVGVHCIIFIHSASFVMSKFLYWLLFPMIPVLIKSPKIDGESNFIPKFHYKEKYKNILYLTVTMEFWSRQNKASLWCWEQIRKSGITGLFGKFLFWALSHFEIVLKNVECFYKLLTFEWIDWSYWRSRIVVIQF